MEVYGKGTAIEYLFAYFGASKAVRQSVAWLAVLPSPLYPPKTIRLLLAAVKTCPQRAEGTVPSTYCFRSIHTKVWRSNCRPTCDQQWIFQKNLNARPFRWACDSFTRIWHAPHPVLDYFPFISLNLWNGSYLVEIVEETLARLEAKSLACHRWYQVIPRTYCLLAQYKATEWVWERFSKKNSPFFSADLQDLGLQTNIGDFQQPSGPWIRVQAEYSLQQARSNLST